MTKKGRCPLALEARTFYMIHTTLITDPTIIDTHKPVRALEWPVQFRSQLRYRGLGHTTHNRYTI